MKQRDLLKRCKEIAQADGAAFTLHREGGKHTIYRVNGQNISIPRHNEIAEGTAKAIMADVETAAKESK